MQVPSGNFLVLQVPTKFLQCANRETESVVTAVTDHRMILPTLQQPERLRYSLQTHYSHYMNALHE